MIPYKHLDIEEKENKILNTSLNRLKLDDRNVPLVAKCYMDKIVLSYWSADITTGEWNWQVHKREHAPIMYPYDNELKKERSPYTLSKFAWSNTIGLTSFKNHAYLVYKRSNSFGSGLFIERLAWDEAENRLVSQDPVMIPLPQIGLERTGFDIWAGAVDNKLIIATQGWTGTGSTEVPHMSLLFLNDPHNSDLSNAASWQLLQVNDGGWDFTSRLDDQTLYQAYRKEPYALEFEEDIEPDEIPNAIGTVTCPPKQINLVNDDLFADEYKPIVLSKINISTGTIEEVYENIPGGEHPQIQSVSPLCLTVDRINSGILTITTQYRCNWNKWWQQKKKWRLFNTNIQGYDKILVRYQADTWAVGRLYSGESEPLVPRNRMLSNTFREMLITEKIVNSDNSIIKFATVETYRPVWQTFQGPLPELDLKQEAIDFLAHSHDTGAVILTRFVISVTNEFLSPNEYGYSVIDINHISVPSPWAVQSNTHLENMQFAQWTVQRPDDVDKIKRQHYQGFSVGDLQSVINQIDNTIGGCLVMDLGGTPLSFFSYSDLGDNGCRVLFNEDAPAPEPVPGIDEKGIEESHVTGPQSSSQEEVIIEQTDDWDDIEMESYIINTNEAPFSGLDSVLDLLIISLPLVPDYEASGATTTIRQDHTVTLELFRHLFSMNQWTTVSAESNDNGLPKAIMKFAPSAIYYGQDVSFDAGDSEEGDNGPLSYFWEFSDGLTFDTATVDRTFFPIPLIEDSREVTLTVTDVDGNTSEVRTTIWIETHIWDTLWEFHSQLNSGSEMAVFEGIELEFSKYKISFHTDNDGNRDYVDITVKDKFHGQWRFIRDAYRQGAIDFRLPIKVSSDEIRLTGIVGDAFNFNELNIEVTYGRRFNPGILTSETRANDPYTNQYTGQTQVHQETPSAIATKPHEATIVEVKDIKVDLSITAAGVAFGLIMDVLTVLGLFAIVTYIAGLISAAAAVAVSSPWGWIIALAIIAGLATYILIEVPKLVARQIKDGIRDYLEGEEFHNNLDAFGFLVNAGEGVAEAIAVAALKIINNEAPAATGTNRFLKNVWDMIFVTTKKIKLLYRKFA